MSKTGYSVSLVVVGLLVVIAALWLRPATPDPAADRAAARLDSLTTRLADLEELRRLDSLYFAGDYRAARAAYATAERPRDSVWNAVLFGRQAQVQRTERLSRAVDTLRRRVPRIDTVLLTPEPVAAPPPPAVPLPVAPDLTADSLRAALARAERRISTLTAAARPPAAPEYLVFRTAEGNEVHYVGQLQNGQAHGRGAAVFSTGSRYRGEWRANLKHGTGVFHWSDGAYYEGAYVDGQREGEGTYHFPDGSRYVGQWANDLRHGRGVYFNKKGKVIARGRWEADAFQE